MNATHRPWLAVLVAAFGIAASSAQADHSSPGSGYYPPCFTAGTTGLPSDLEYSLLRIRSELSFRNYALALNPIGDLDYAIRSRMSSPYPTPYPAYYRDRLDCFSYGRTGLIGIQEDLFLRVRTELLNRDLGNAQYSLWQLGNEVRRSIGWVPVPQYPAPRYPEPRYPAPPSYPEYPRHPGHPGYPRHPGHPGYPRHPGHPGYPHHPGHPGYPRHPGHGHGGGQGHGDDCRDDHRDDHRGGRGRHH